MRPVITLLQLCIFANAWFAQGLLIPQDLTFTSELEYALSNHFASNDPQSIFRLTKTAEFTHNDNPKGSTFTPTYTGVRAVPTTIYRPRSVNSFLHARLRSFRHSESETIEWERVETLGPDVQDLHTLTQLARMSGNAYALPGQNNWYDVDLSWNISFPFGWEDAANGFRGHVFLSPDNSTVILSIKGTTLQGPTSKKDKFNDNLLFSCCCARVDFSWIFSTVCDCYAKHWRCDDTCLSEALIEDSLFYNVGVNLINNLTSMYPTSTIWLTGHSLGGGLASLLGTTFGFPAVAFEAPGERLAAQRLHLPLPPSEPISSYSPPSTHPTSYTPSFASAPVTHVYHNADPIPQGACTGLYSPCSQAGFALETRCHLGKTIVFDTVGQLGWKVDVLKHPIKEVILNVLEREVPEYGWDGWGREVPLAMSEEDCVDCYKWEFGDYKEKKLQDSESHNGP
ncbi:hypothetical protein QCA50_003337 [Cerrena zonata]|uniref:triacylglycerol lipase n=1 Tax=Cerrena zonata TaxID=2478898 RepID=A0AAW0GKK7_9APHY